MSIQTVIMKSERELEQILVNDIGIVEKGLTIIASQIPINSSTRIDALCHDENGTLVILKISTEENDQMLFDSLQTLRQVDALKHMMKFFYSRFKINDAEMPRLILLAPSFSANLTRIASHLVDLRVDLYEWEYLKFGDQKALRVEPVFGTAQTKNKTQVRKALKEDKEKEQSVEPTEPEIMSQPEISPDSQQTTPQSTEQKEEKETSTKKTFTRF
jgi:hypothetical protein